MSWDNEATSAHYIGPYLGGNTAIPMEGQCRWCSTTYMPVVHAGACPKVAELEYYPNGTLKRVRFKEPHDD